jgi:hypothetical protein
VRHTPHLPFVTIFSRLATTDDVVIFNPPQQISRSKYASFAIGILPRASDDAFATLV